MHAFWSLGFPTCGWAGVCAVSEAIGVPSKEFKRICTQLTLSRLVTRLAVSTTRVATSIALIVTPFTLITRAPS